MNTNVTVSVNGINPTHGNFYMGLLLSQQMQWLFLILILVLALALALCTWIMLSAQAERLTSLIAPEALLSAVLLSIHMQEYDVKVWISD